MKIIIVLCLIPFGLGSNGIEPNICVVERMLPTFSPQNEKEEFIFMLYQYKEEFIKYNISPDLAITQAICEQGYTLRSDYRIYNLSTNGNHNHKTIWDNYTQKYRKHRVYPTLRAAITDYCQFLNNNSHYKEILNEKNPIMQIHYMALSPYAEASHRYRTMMRVYLENVLPVLNEIRQYE